MAEIAAQKIKLKSGQVVIIRSAWSGDAKAVIEYARIILAGDLYNVTTLEEFKWTIKKEREWIRGRLKHPARILLVAELGGRIAGILGLENSSRRRMQHVGNIHTSVHPKFRRISIAIAMMKAAIAWAKKNPVIEKLTLEVFCTNRPAIRLYEKMGFKREGLRVKTIKLEDGRYVDDVLMARFVKGRRGNF